MVNHTSNGPVYDCAVIGLGAMGSAALLAAAKRDWSVIGLEQFGKAHDQGSSHGQTRILRQAYFEHPNYVPLTLQAYQAWDALAAEVDQTLRVQSGLLQIGPPHGEVIQGVLRSAALHGLDIESLTYDEMERRFPCFEIPKDTVGAFEKVASYLHVERCVEAMLSAAENRGAQLRFQTQVVGCHRTADCLELTCQRHPVHGDHLPEMLPAGEVSPALEKLRARHLVITGGPWSHRLFPLLSLPVPAELDLSILAKFQHWFLPNNPESAAAKGASADMPTYLVETPQGCFYGFPQVESGGWKVAEHSGGTQVAYPQQLNAETVQADLTGVQNFAERFLRLGQLQCLRTSQCYYTMSPDEHFVVDSHPLDARIAYALGMSGHGFKFAPVIGTALINILAGENPAEFDFLRASRFQQGSPANL